ncbi:MAG: methyltransferase domain-containing protein [Polyangiaceae bacterium]|nr:methyltransferase domain-containing protein [Polyangiaceae bacterium]
MARTTKKGAATPEEYIRAAIVDAEERCLLLEAVISGHTRRFRDEAQLLEIIRHLGSVSLPLRPRIWSAGCSTGEEPLSLLSLLKARGVTAIDLVATDVASGAVEATKAALSNCDPLTRVLVIRHDLVHEPPPQWSFDAILCRNVLMYYEARAARAAFDRLTTALSDRGRIFMGAADLLALRPEEGDRNMRLQNAVEQPKRRAPQTPETPRSGPAERADSGGSLSALLCEAEAALGMRKLEQAEELLLRAEELAPDRAETHYLFGVLHRKRGDRGAALSSLRRATFLSPTLWKAFLLLADEWRLAGHAGRADAAERQATRLKEEAESAPEGSVQ